MPRTQPRGRKPKNPEALDEALRLVTQEGVSQQEAARRTGASQATISQRITRVSGAKDGAAASTEPTDAGEIPVFVRHYEHLDRLFVFPLGDVHIGSSNFQEAKWQEWLSYITEHEDTSMLGTGDFLNVALKDSVSDVYTEALTVPQAKRKLRADLRPLAERDRIDLLIPGNHEARITRATGECPIDDTADALDVSYAPAVAIVRYLVGDQTYDVFVRHGSGSGRPGAQATKMEREALTVVCDVYVQGHVHRQQVLRGVIFQVEGDPPSVARRRQLYVTAGSMLSYEEYAAKAGLAPSDIGVPRLRFDGTRKDAHASV